MAGHKVRVTGEAEVWARPLADGSRAVALLNRGKEPVSISVQWTDLGYPEHLQASVRDLWAYQDKGKAHGTFAADVPGHGVVMLKIKP